MLFLKTSANFAISAHTVRTLRNIWIRLQKVFESGEVVSFVSSSPASTLLMPGHLGLSTGTAPAAVRALQPQITPRLPDLLGRYKFLSRPGPPSAPPPSALCRLQTCPFFVHSGSISTVSLSYIIIGILMLLAVFFYFTVHYVPALHREMSRWGGATTRIWPSTNIHKDPETFHFSIQGPITGNNAGHAEQWGMHQSIIFFYYVIYLGVFMYCFTRKRSFCCLSGTSGNQVLPRQIGKYFGESNVYICLVNFENA